MTIDQLQKAVPGSPNPTELLNALNEILPKYEITEPTRAAAFLAQCGHESLDFTAMEENLNYSAPALTRVWPTHFPTIQIAVEYERQPEKIANRAYANGNGNGDEASGDGWIYRGRGAIQLTGKANYQAFADATGKSLSDTVEYTGTLTGGIEAAAWFWKEKGLNALADNKWNNENLTRVINGGLNGLADRNRRYDRVLAALTG